MSINAEICSYICSTTEELDLYVCKQSGCTSENVPVVVDIVHLLDTPTRTASFSCGSFETGMRVFLVFFSEAQVSIQLHHLVFRVFVVLVVEVAIRCPTTSVSLMVVISFYNSFSPS